MKKIFFLVAFVCLTVSAQAQTPLATLANSMQPGTWALLNTNNISQILGVGGNSGNILSYASTGSWDPIGKKLHFEGQDHNAPTGKVWATYDEATNTWSSTSSSQSGIPNNNNHSYDDMTIDPVGRVLYMLMGGNLVDQYPLATNGPWSAITPFPNLGYLNLNKGLAFFNGHGLVVYNCGSGAGEILIRDLSGNWSTRIANFGMDGGIQCFAEDSPAKNIVLIGGASLAIRKIWRLNADYTVTALTDAPLDLGIQAGNVVADPVSGNFIVWGFHQLWELNPSGAGTWTSLSNLPPSAVGDPTQTSVFSTAISTYGVIAYTTCRITDCNVYLYKHGASVAPPIPPDPTPIPVPPQTTTIFGATAPTVASGDNSIEVGVKFRSDIAGAVTGVRFYNGPLTPGVHTGSLWSASCQLLATGTFTGGTATGWQSLTFASPVAITANTTYIASYHAPSGYFFTTNGFGSQGVDSPPLHALKNGVDGVNGVYRYGSTSACPTQSYQSTNYWADVIFGGTAPPAPNQPPVITVGPDQTVTGSFSATFQLTGSATDDPTQSLTYQWALVSGPGTVTLATPNAASTSAVVNTSGTFLFRLTVSDGMASSSKDVLVIVNTPVAGFSTKCSQAGVISCWSFDDAAQLFYAWPPGTACDSAFAGKTNNLFGSSRNGPGNTVAVIQNNQCLFPQIDKAIAHSGAGSLKFTIPSNSASDTSGYFSEPFKRNADGTFPYIAPGSPLGNVVYFQFYQRFDSVFATYKYAPQSGWKQIIMYGNPPNGSSSSSIEVTMVNGGLLGIPVMYGQAGTDDYGLQDIRGCFYNFNGLNTYPEPPCIRYKPNQWMEFTGRIEVRGTRNSPESRVQIWIDGQLAVDYQKAKINWGSLDGQGIGQFLISPYHTGKDPSQTTPVGYTWVDDVIVSTKPIAMKAS